MKSLRHLNLRKSSCISSLALLLSACDTSVEPQVYPEAGSASAKLYQTKCTGCHVAPNPNAHIPQAWFRVVQRMQMRMKAKGVAPLNQNELGEILDYLQRNAAMVEAK